MLARWSAASSFRRRCAGWWSARRGDEVSVGAFAFDAFVVAVLVVVMEPTQPTQVPQCRGALLFDRGVVIDLEVPVDVTALDRAFRELLDHSRPEPGRDRPAQMTHGQDVGPVVDERLEHRIGGALLSDEDRNRPDPGDLT